MAKTRENIEVVKSIKVHGKLYTEAKHAANRWVEFALSNQYNKKWYPIIIAHHGFDAGSVLDLRHRKAFERCMSKARRKRFVKLVLPYFQRLL